MHSGDSHRKDSTARSRRRALRKNAPRAEQILWSRLRNRQFLNCKFRRQHSFGTYVVDFYSKELKLAIELDGDSHFIGDSEKHDRERENRIERYGVQFLRFTNVDVFENLDGVLHDLSEKILELRDEAQE